jgi:hypothetical protein
MNERRGTIGVALFAAVAWLSGCGSSSSGGPSSGGGSCSPPSLDGSVFGGTGTGTLTGNGTLPDGIADGLELEVLVKTGAASIGVLPDNLLTENDRICGKTFHYNVKKIEAGTHTLIFEVFDTSSASTDPVFEGTAPSDFTIADGQSLNVDTTFQLTPKP